MMTMKKMTTTTLMTMMKDAKQWETVQMAAHWDPRLFSTTRPVRSFWD